MRGRKRGYEGKRTSGEGRVDMKGRKSGHKSKEKRI